jgi:hypothetical protein
MEIKMSPVTKDQWVKVFKALAYAFVSAFVVALGASGELSKSALAAAAVAGVNAVLVAVKQLFTDGEPQG